MQSGGRVLLRRTAGFDLHSVREYEQGESLRKVHWPTTARRGTLMVKELEDMPHDEVAVLLDARRARRWSASPSTCRCGRRARSCARMPCAAAARCSRSPRRRRSRATSRRSTASGGSRSSCSRRPSRRAPSRSRAFLDRDASAASQAAELVVVTGVARRPADRRAPRTGFCPPADGSRPRRDGELRAGGAAPARDPALLRLHAAGVPVATLRKGRRPRGEAERLRGGVRGAWLGPQPSRSASASSSSWNWARLEEPRASIGPMLLMVLLGTAPALLPTLPLAARRRRQSP